jgi:hypothetical protein
MLRSRSAACFLLAPILFVVLASTFGCGGYSEGPLVRKFFVASRMSDNTTLAPIATTTFDPRKDGQVENLSIVSETPEQVVPLALKSSAEAYRAAQKEEEEFTSKWRAYQDFNRDAIKKVRDADKKGLKLKGKDGEVQEEMGKWRADTEQIARKVSDARTAVSRERPLVELSMQNPLKPIDPTDYEGVLATKEMTISANVRTPEGQSVRKNLVITLQQARMKGPQGDIIGKWIITKVAEAREGARS